MFDVIITSFFMLISITDIQFRGLTFNHVTYSHFLVVFYSKTLITYCCESLFAGQKYYALPVIY